MAFLMTMLGEIVVDMAPFLMVQVAVLTALAFALLLLHSEGGGAGASADGYDSPGSALFTSYNLLVHGAGTDDALYRDGSATIVLLFYTMTIFVTVVMLNALIAIMGDTYDRVSETRKERGQQQRAELLLEMESMMLSRRNGDGGFAHWLHRPCGRQRASGRRRMSGQTGCAR